MPIRLAELIGGWDREYEATLPDDSSMDSRRPYHKILESLQSVAALRFQPYQNDRIPGFIEKLQAWLSQFGDADQPAAFLLASKVLFVTQRQFESLQRRLYQTLIRRHFLHAAIARKRYRSYEFRRAAEHLTEEMDASLFLANSDSASLNSFVHLNSEFFNRREQRHLVGPELAFWVYPARRAIAPGATEAVRAAALEFQESVLSADKHMEGKRRLVVIEDFAGTGDDLKRSMQHLALTRLPVREIVVAPAMATARAIWRLRRLAHSLTRTSSYTFHVLTAYVLPDNLRCFGAPSPSYLDGQPPIPDLSEHVRRLADDIYETRFRHHLPSVPRYGYGALALAFAFFANCPDNSLPFLWNEQPDWRALFPRASHYL